LQISDWRVEDAVGLEESHHHPRPGGLLWRSNGRYLSPNRRSALAIRTRARGRWGCDPLRGLI
jgi:hypothetical protein